jgi:hypothetical protein
LTLNSYNIPITTSFSLPSSSSGGVKSTSFSLPSSSSGGVKKNLPSPNMPVQQPKQSNFDVLPCSDMPGLDTGYSDKELY